MLGIRAATADAASTLYLPVQTAEAQALLDTWYTAGLLTELALPEVPASTEEFPVPAPIPTPSPRVGLLYWPGFGAQRFAFGTFLIDYYTLGRLRASLNGASVDPDGSGGGGPVSAGANKVILSYTDKDVDDPLSPEVPRDFTMYLVAARPLSQTTGTDLPPATPPTEDDGYIITLVDQRYYWQFMSGGGTSGIPASWASLFNKFLTQLNATTGPADTVPAAYLTPSAKWDAAFISGFPSAVLFDSAAYSVGMRVVFAPDETVSIQGPTTAHFNTVTAFHTAAVADFRHNSGGLVPVIETVRAVPEKVLVAFPAPGCVSPATQTKALNALPWVLGSNYYGIAGVPGAQAILWSDAAQSTPSADRVALTAQFAADWYNWQVVPLEATYIGFPPLPASGYVGHFELVHTGDEGYTRVTRPPANYGQLFGKGSDCTGGSAHIVRLVSSGTGLDGGTAWQGYIQKEAGATLVDDVLLGSDCAAGTPYVLYAGKTASGGIGKPQPNDWVVAVPDPHIACRWGFIPKNLDESQCNDCGFLLDLDPNACLLASFLGSPSGVGRCHDMPIDLGGTSTSYMLPSGDGLAWDLVKMGTSCCGCGEVQLQISPAFVGGAAIILTNYHVSCLFGAGTGSGGVYSSTLVLQCCGTKIITCSGGGTAEVPYAVFVGYGSSNCSGCPVGTDNTFRILVSASCGCPPPICTCQYCGECCTGATPFAWKFTIPDDAGGFPDSHWNGSWVLNADPLTNCLYKGDCHPPKSGVDTDCCNGGSGSTSGAEYVSQLFPFEGPGPGVVTWELDHGGSVYQQTVWGCCSDNTMTRVSGTGGPTEIVVHPIMVRPCGAGSGSCPTCTYPWPASVTLEILSITLTDSACTPYTVGDLITLVQATGFDPNTNIRYWNHAAEVSACCDGSTSGPDTQIQFVCSGGTGGGFFSCTGFSVSFGGADCGPGSFTVGKTCSCFPLSFEGTGTLSGTGPGCCFGGDGLGTITMTVRVTE